MRSHESYPQGAGQSIPQPELLDCSNVNADGDWSQDESATSGSAGSDAAEMRHINALKAELAAEKERFLRLAADFDNFRKRITQESEGRAAAQKKAFIQELLPIIDNLERAVGSGSSTSEDPVLKGVDMTLQQLNRLLRVHGVESQDCIGQPFDPHVHEAVGSRYDPEKPDHVILEVIQPGYSYGSEILRPAKVVINDHSQQRPFERQLRKQSKDD